MCWWVVFGPGGSGGALSAGAGSKVRTGKRGGSRATIALVVASNHSSRESFVLFFGGGAPIEPIFSPLVKCGNEDAIASSTFPQLVPDMAGAGGGAQFGMDVAGQAPAPGPRCGTDTFRRRQRGRHELVFRRAGESLSAHRITVLSQGSVKEGAPGRRSTRGRWPG
jgi:hypothetical protein